MEWREPLPAKLHSTKRWRTSFRWTDSRWNMGAIYRTISYKTLTLKKNEIRSHYCALTQRTTSKKYPNRTAAPSVTWPIESFISSIDESLRQINVTSRPLGSSLLIRWSYAVESYRHYHSSRRRLGHVGHPSTNIAPSTHGFSILSCESARRLRPTPWEED